MLIGTAAPVRPLTGRAVGVRPRAKGTQGENWGGGGVEEWGEKGGMGLDQERAMNKRMSCCCVCSARCLKVQVALRVDEHYGPPLLRSCAAGLVLHLPRISWRASPAVTVACFWRRLCQTLYGGVGRGRRSGSSWNERPLRRSWSFTGSVCRTLSR
jgi:hypothetical protein